MERHLQALADKERAVLEEERRQKHQHTPAINPVSDAIAAQLPVSSRERLSMPHRSGSTFVDPHSITRLQAPSRSVSAVSITEDERFEIHARQQERREQRMDELRQQAAQREMQECTFAPVTSPASSRVRATTPTQNLADRSTQWSKKREQWRNEQLRAKTDAEVADCTFAPTTHAREGRSALTPQRSIYGGEGRAWGTDEFVLRQKQAREKADEERRRQTFTGSTWKNRTTVPEEPQLGRVDRAHVRSLAKPTAVPGLYDDDDYARYSPERAADRPHRADSAGSTIPSPSHFSNMRQGTAHAAPPLVPFAVNEHRAAFNMHR